MPRVTDMADMRMSKGKMELNDKGESERTGCGEQANKPITNKAIVKKRKDIYIFSTRCRAALFDSRLTPEGIQELS